MSIRLTYDVPMNRQRSLLISGLLLWACLAGAGQIVQGAEATLPYNAEEVSYENPAAAGVVLAGTMTVPRKKAAVPAVLLVSGAGPQDRDETIDGHKPFQVLADYLTRHDIAVLRVDDRGVGQSTGDYKSATTKDFASDAQAGVRYLMTRPDVDHKHIGMIGHGEGAIVAGILAAEMPQVSYIVLLSGTAVAGDKVLLAQTARAEMAAGISEDQMDADLRIGRGLYQMAEAGRSEGDMQQALENVPEQYKRFTEPWKSQLPRLQSAWLRSFLTYDPSLALEQVKCPVLALFGEKDMAVDPEQNAAAMKKAFGSGHNREAKIKILPDLNYLFQKAHTGLANEYSSLGEPMSAGSLEIIETWIEKQGE